MFGLLCHKLKMFPTAALFNWPWTERIPIWWAENLPPKIRKSFLQLGSGHFAQLAFWKFCFRDRYSFGKNVLAVWFSSVEKRRGDILNIIASEHLHSHLHFLIAWIDYVWFIQNKKEKKKRQQMQHQQTLIFSLFCFCVTLASVINTRI